MQWTGLVAGALIAGLAGSTVYFYLEAQQEDTRPPEFGALSAVNRVVLADQSYTDRCEVFDDQGVGQGLVLFEWSFEFNFGVDVPQNWAWNITQSEDGAAEIELPPLGQLATHYVEFTSAHEIDPANGNRWQRMIGVATSNAHARIDRAENVMLQGNDEIRETARGAARDLLLPILQSVEPATPIADLNVRFADDDDAASNSETLSFLDAVRCT